MQQVDHKLRKTERLKSRKEISDLFESGKIVHHQYFKVLYKLKPQKNVEFPAQIAISVSKRNFKHAVDRNHIKRKIRESYRKNKEKLYFELKKNDQNLSFFVIYTSNVDLDYDTISNAMNELVKKIAKKLKS